MPPYFSGTGPPSRPTAAILRSTSFGKFSPRSRSRAPGAISLSAKSFSGLRMDCCSGVRSKSKPRVYGVPMFDDRRRPLREDELARIAGAIDPRARAMRSAPNLGGLDAATYALDLDVAGNRRDLVIQLFTLSEHRDGNAARRYWKAIDAIPATAPVPVPGASRCGGRTGWRPVHGDDAVGRRAPRAPGGRRQLDRSARGRPRIDPRDRRSQSSSRLRPRSHAGRWDGISSDPLRTEDPGRSLARGRTGAALRRHGRDSEYAGLDASRLLVREHLVVRRAPDRGRRLG